MARFDFATAPLLGVSECAKCKDCVNRGQGGACSSYAEVSNHALEGSKTEAERSVLAYVTEADHEVRTKLIVENNIANDVLYT